MLHKLSLLVIMLCIVIILIYSNNVFGASNLSYDATKMANSSRWIERSNTSNLQHQKIDDQPVLSIFTDKRQYAPGEIVKIFGNVYNLTGEPLTQRVHVQISSYDDKTKKTSYVYDDSVLANNGSYIFGFDAPSPNKYTVVTSLERWNETAFTKFNSIDVINPTVSTTSLMLYIALICFIIFLVLLPVVSTYSVSIMELISFVLISAIVLSPLVALLSSNIELGVDAPIGVILKPPADERTQPTLNNLGQPQMGGQWMLNVGGNKHNNYSDGIQIPLYVITFGLIGGYLRYLYDTTSRREYFEEQIEKIEVSPGNDNDKRKKKRRLFVSRNIKALGLIFLSPILAITIWFTLSQIGIQGQQQAVQGQIQTGVFVLAAVSFTVGLVTEEVVQSLIKFTREKLPGSGSGSVSNTTSTAGYTTTKGKIAADEGQISKRSLLDNLERLADLKQKCSLTEDEFLKLKEELFK
jgi:hypothetical protein